MKVGECCNRQVVISQADESLKVVAELMRAHHVGDVVLVEERNAKRIPIGIITDRDIVLEVLATGLEPEKLAARDIIKEPLYVVQEDTSLFDALELMQQCGIRRLPVVNGENVLAGIITIDDVTELLTEMMSRVTGVIKRQQKQEESRRP